MVREQAITFGGGRFLGVLTHPPERNDGGVCLVILNAGLIHRAGPGRLSVDTARRAATVGASAFRFDLSGLGDTPSRVPPLGVVESAVGDVREALDHLEAHYGFRSFVMLGLCSGAVLAHHAAVADARVRGAVLLDGYSYATLWSRLSAAVGLLQHPLSLVRSAFRRARRLVFGDARPVVHSDEDRLLPRTPRRSRVEADLNVLMTRGVKLLHVFTGEWTHLYSYEGQIRDAFPRVAFGTAITERRIAAAEHLLFTPPEREEWLDILAEWLRERFVWPKA